MLRVPSSSLGRSATNKYRRLCTKTSAIATSTLPSPVSHQKTPPNEVALRKKANGLPRRVYYPKWGSYQGQMSNHDAVFVSGSPGYTLFRDSDFSQEYHQEGGFSGAVQVNKKAFISSRRRASKYNRLRQQILDDDRVFVVDGLESDVIRDSDFVDETPDGGSVALAADLAYERRLLNTLKATKSADEAWDTYCALLSISEQSESEIPLHLKRRLNRLIGDFKPKTRTHFLRLLAVASSIHKSGEQLTVHEWNKLIHASASGLRRKSHGDFRLAFEIYKDMVEGRAPGSQFGGMVANLGGDDASGQSRVKPDVVTYNTLLSIAARTGDTRTLHRATALFQNSGFPPNRVAHLTMLEFFRRTKQLHGVRSTLLKMRQQGLDLGLDGLQTCIWVFGYLECSRIVSMIYRVLRHNVIPDTGVDEQGFDIGRTIGYLDEIESIVIPQDILPNESLYTVTVQVLASCGDFPSSLRVFLDYLSTNHSHNTGVNSEARPENSVTPMILFRAFFHSFSRHGVPGSRNQAAEDESDWNEENLQLFFDAFIKLPPESKPSASTIFWIVNSFNKVTRGDKEKLREIWSRMEDAFGRPQVSGNSRLQRIRTSLLGAKSEDLLSTTGDETTRPTT